MTKKMQRVDMPLTEWTHIQIQNATKDFVTRDEVARDIEMAKTDLSKAFESWPWAFKIIIAFLGFLGFLIALFFELFYVPQILP